jgi:segregation and condensation protein B
MESCMETVQTELPQSQQLTTSSEEFSEGPVVEKLPVEQHPGIIEALVFVHSEPLSIQKIATLSDLSTDEVRTAIDIIKQRYESVGSGFELREVAGKVQLRTKSDYAKYVRALTAAKPKRLSAAALETLAIIAYQQPIVKSEVEKIRGVDTSPTLKTLLEKKLIKIIGHQATVFQSCQVCVR